MRLRQRWIGLLVLAMTTAFTASAADSPDAFLGRWALTIPGNAAGWLGVTQEQGYLDASMLWGGGSVFPLQSAYVDGDTLVVTREHRVTRKDKESGKVIRKHVFTETITARVSGDVMSLTRRMPRSNGKGVSESTFSGKRIPPLPPKPDLSKVKFDDPFVLFGGANLRNWHLINPRATSGWSSIDGMMINNPVKKRGVHYGNLRTEEEYNDFNLTLEVSVDEGGNSGVYLRGIYEVQVFASYGKEPDSHNMGAIYSRIAPSVTADKPINEWQTLDITLVDRHVTVILNGTKIIDNEALLGCTGGALWADESRPGPIYLQGDHSAVRYRNILIRPVLGR